MCQPHGQAHGAFGLCISAQTTRHRTFGRRGSLIDRLANPRAIDRQRAQRPRRCAIGVGHQSKQQVLLAEIGMAVTARLGVGLFEGHSRGNGEIVDQPHGPLGRLGGVAAGASLVFGLFFQPIHQPGLGNEPFSPQMYRRYHPILQELIHSVLIQPQPLADPVGVAVIEIPGHAGH